MSKKIKLSKEELEILKGYQQQQNSITFELGQVDINRAILEGQRASVLDKLGDLQEKTYSVVVNSPDSKSIFPSPYFSCNSLAVLLVFSCKTAKELQEKYGDGNIDLESGEFTTTE